MESVEKSVTVANKAIQIERPTGTATLSLRRLGKSDVQNALAYANGVGFCSETIYVRTLVSMAITKVDGQIVDADGEVVPTKPSDFVSRGVIERMAPPALYDVLTDDEAAAILAFAAERLTISQKKA